MSSASSPLEQTVRSGAHGFRPRRPRSLVAVLNFCRITVNSSLLTPFEPEADPSCGGSARKKSGF